MSATHLKTGKDGEEQAAAWLSAQGYLILARNWTSGKCELDIVASKGGWLVFVEVKTRHDARYGWPEESVTRTKQRHLCQAALAYMEENKMDCEFRFDVIAITEGELMHFPDSFVPFP